MARGSCGRRTSRGAVVVRHDRGRAAEHQLPRLPQHQHHPGRRVSLTKVMGRHTMKTGFYNSHSLKRENNVQGAADNFGTLSFAQGHGRHQPLRHVVRVRQRGDRQLQLVRAGLEICRGNFTYNNTEGYIQDNWKVNNQADARLRRALRARAAAARQPAAERQLPAGQVGPVAGAEALRRRLRQRRATRAPAPTVRR